jgi:translation initiation factor 4A
MHGKDTLCSGFDIGVPIAEELEELVITYAIPALHKIRTEQKVPQVLILVPSSEYGRGVHALVSALGKNMSVRCFHASSSHEQANVDHHLVIGTSQQVGDMLAQGRLQLTHLRMLVLHDSGKILCPAANRGFSYVSGILAAVPTNIQCCAFSKVQDTEQAKLLRTVLRDEVVLLLNQSDCSMEECRHMYIAIEREEWKLDTICDLFETITDRSWLVICNSRRRADGLSHHLARRDFPSIPILEADEWRQALRQMQPGLAQTLIVSDSALCNMDHAELGQFVIVNYDLPASLDSYRTRLERPYSRYGKKYFALNFVTNNDVRTMKDIERHFHIHIEEMPMDIDDLL